MTKQPANDELLRVIENSIARVGLKLCGRETRAIDVEDAFGEVLFIWFLFRYMLKKRFRLSAPLRQMSQADKFARLWPQIVKRIDPTFVNNAGN